MQLTLNKTELAGALAALGKLICRSSPIPMFRAVQIEATNNVLLFRTHNMTEEIEFRMDVEASETFRIAVDFDFFRSLVKNCRNKNITFEFKDGKLLIDDVPIASVDGEWPVAETPQGDNVATSPLPENFVEILNQAAPQAGVDDPRNILKGINLSQDGITATNGKELFNFPYRFNLDELTIPFPLALMATKVTGEGNITTWNNDLYVMFVVSIGKWRWTARALPGSYPNWKCVMPDSKNLKHFVSFTTDYAERMKLFLKGLPDSRDLNRSGTELFRNNIGELALHHASGLSFSVPAEFDSTWGDFSVVIKKDILLHLLGKGHTRIELSDAFGPFIGTGGTGRYVAMSMRIPKTEPQAQQIAVQSKQPASPESKDQAKVITPTITNTNSNQEKSTMIDTNTIHTVSASNVQTFTPNRKPEAKQSPIDELISVVDEFKAKLKTLTEESAIIGRKAREIAIDQKQKEREYVQTRKTIDRIRTASGF